MGKIDFKIENQGDTAVVTLNGSIDEDVDLNTINLSQMSKFELNLEGLKAINSCGIREWIKWLSQYGKSEIVFSNCPKVIVDQINMVDGFLPQNAKVKSFYVPYYNDDAGSEKNVLFKLGKEFSDGQIHPPEQVLDEDGQPMEMDVIESKYFKFIKK